VFHVCNNPCEVWHGILQVSKSKSNKPANPSKSLPTHNRITSEEYAKCGKFAVQEMNKIWDSLI
jgi:hypothetical protein